MLALVAAGAAQAEDVEITSDTPSVDLDTYAGTTVRIWPSVTIPNGVRATTQAWTITNDGILNAQVRLDKGGTFTNSADATIDAASTALIFGYKPLGQPPIGGPGYLHNYGSIKGTVEGVTMWLGGTVVNHEGGLISTSGSSNAVSVGQGDARTVINSGEIRADRTTGFSTGILVQGGPATVTNNGTGIVTGGYNGVYASATTPLTFTNHGSITSVRGPAVEAAGGGAFTNTGTIQSGVDGMLISEAATVTNSGTIGSTGTGRAIVFSGADEHTLILGTGSVLTGNVAGGTGTDNLVLQGTGTESIAKFLSFETLSMQGSAWTLTGIGTFSTGATVESGTLNVNGTLTGPTVMVQGGGLGGSGTIAGAVSFAATNTALYGSAGQLLTMDSLTLGASTAVNVTLGAPSDTALFAVNGALTLDGTLNVTNAGGFGTGVYRIFDYGGALTDNGLDVGAMPTGNTGTVQTAVANQVNLVVEASGPDPVPTVQFWNGTTTVADGTIHGGTGIWSADSTTNWTDANGTSAVPWAGNFAVFQNNAATVTLDSGAGAVAATGMQFIGAGWTVTGAALTLNGVGGDTPIRVGDGTTAGASHNATIASELTGNSRLVKDDLGTLILTGANSYTGGTIIANGTLQIGNGGTVGAIVGDVADNGTLVFNRSNALVFSGRLSGSGSIRQIGSGRTELTGNSSGFAGVTTVENGILAVNGQLGGRLDVRTTGRLEGIGTVGATNVSGTIAPGNSIGTLNVAGNVVFNPGSIYQVEVDAAGQADKISATGAATINGGKVEVLAGMGDYAPATTYTILTASGGRTGTFTEGVTSNLAFLTPSLSYDANNVFLTMTRNTFAFDNAGMTPNQKAAGSGVESLRFGNTVYNAVLKLSADQARFAFDRVSGELHLSVRGAMLEDSRFIRDAVNDRLRYAPAPTGRFAVWGQAFGAWGHLSGDGNAARLGRSLGGVFIGADALAFDAWRFGMVAGYSRSSFKVNDRHSSGSSDNYHLGLYGGAQWGGLAVRMGAAYTWHDIAVSRNAAFSGFTDSLESGYKAGTGQAFGELAYGIHTGGFAFEPFAQLAYVNLHTDSFVEKGGAAALTGKAANTDATFTMLGLHASAGFAFSGANVTVRGMAGWRHAFGDITPDAVVRFASGGDSFTIAGVPNARDAAVVEAGLDLALSPNAALGVTYGNQSGSGLSDQSIRAAFNVKF